MQIGQSREVSEGAGLLQQFLQSNGITQTAAGEALGVSGVTVHDWVTGAKRPKAHHREAIALWTSGFVPVDSWRFAREREAVAIVRPFEPTSDSSENDSSSDADESGSFGPSDTGTTGTAA